jgi:hypothetical protein
MRQTPRETSVGPVLVVDEHGVDRRIAIDQRHRLGTHHHVESTRPETFPQRLEERRREHHVAEKAGLRNQDG